MDYAEIIGKILGAVVVAIIAYLTPKFNAWLEAKVGSEKAEVLRRLIMELVTAADQLFKTEDPTGQIRKRYVEQQIEALGYKITDDINAMIESAVWSINLNNGYIQHKEEVEDEVHAEAESAE